MRSIVDRTVFGALLVAATAMPAAAADHAILQKDKAFSQATLNIRAGDRIVFTNGDSFTHNVYSVTPGQEFELKTQHPGKSDAVPFPRAGSLEVQCAIHPKMKLRVTVTQ